MSDVNEVKTRLPTQYSIDMLFKLASDYLSSKQQERIAPCNPEFLIQQLRDKAKILREYEEKLLRLYAEVSECADGVVED